MNTPETQSGGSLKPVGSEAVPALQGAGQKGVSQRSGRVGRQPWTARRRAGSADATSATTCCVFPNAGG